ncbi:MAG TPA: cytochrome P460 family protein [Candidatus Dormibacteraeota bacterium]|jgi:hypothetical protein|nr:cytochrome P460 family protein [Candidatus Dormibacteraeota bacterium]
MKKAFSLGACVALMAGIASWMGQSQPSVSAAETVGAPQYATDGKLVRPTGYRKWVYLSSGYGMSYSDNPTPDGHLMFTNVFVTPSSYDYYVQHGTWPDKTMFVLELYGSASKGSINKHGNFQSEFMGLDVEVKDEKKFEDKWAYFGFNATEGSSEATKPSKNDCWNCHDQNAAVEHSFVQFYPELLKIARSKGTIKPTVHLE